VKFFKNLFCVLTIALFSFTTSFSEPKQPDKIDCEELVEDAKKQISQLFYQRNSYKDQLIAQRALIANKLSNISEMIGNLQFSSGNSDNTVGDGQSSVDQEELLEERKRLQEALSAINGKLHSLESELSKVSKALVALPTSISASISGAQPYGTIIVPPVAEHKPTVRTHPLEVIVYGCCAVGAIILLYHAGKYAWSQWQDKEKKRRKKKRKRWEKKIKAAVRTEVATIDGDGIRRATVDLNDVTSNLQRTAASIEENGPARDVEPVDEDRMKAIVTQAVMEARADELDRDRDSERDGPSESSNSLTADEVHTVVTRAIEAKLGEDFGAQSDALAPMVREETERALTTQVAEELERQKIAIVGDLQEIISSSEGVPPVAAEPNIDPEAIRALMQDELATLREELAAAREAAGESGADGQEGLAEQLHSLREDLARVGQETGKQLESMHQAFAQTSAGKYKREMAHHQGELLKRIQALQRANTNYEMLLLVPYVDEGLLNADPSCEGTIPYLQKLRRIINQTDMFRQAFCKSKSEYSRWIREKKGRHVNAVKRANSALKRRQILSVGTPDERSRMSPNRIKGHEVTRAGQLESEAVRRDEFSNLRHMPKNHRHKKRRTRRGDDEASPDAASAAETEESEGGTETSRELFRKVGTLGPESGSDDVHEAEGAAESNPHVKIPLFDKRRPKGKRVPSKRQRRSHEVTLRRSQAKRAASMEALKNLFSGGSADGSQKGLPTHVNTEFMVSGSPQKPVLRQHQTGRDQAKRAAKMSRGGSADGKVQPKDAPVVKPKRRRRKKKRVNEEALDNLYNGGSADGTQKKKPKRRRGRRRRRRR